MYQESILPEYQKKEGHEVVVLTSECASFHLSILEAYATGYAVITNQSVRGIRNIFENNINEISIINRDVEDIFNKIENILENQFFQENYRKSKEKYGKNFVCRKDKKILCKKNTI